MFGCTQVEPLAFSDTAQQLGRIELTACASASIAQLDPQLGPIFQQQQQ